MNKDLPINIVAAVGIVAIVAVCVFMAAMGPAEIMPAGEEAKPGPGYIRVVTKVNTFNGRVTSVEYKWIKPIDKAE